MWQVVNDPKSFLYSRIERNNTLTVEMDSILVLNGIKIVVYLFSLVVVNHYCRLFQESVVPTSKAMAVFKN